MGIMRYQPQSLLRPANNPYGQRLIAAATPTDSLYGVTHRSSTASAGPLGLYTPGGSGSYIQSTRNAPIFLGRQGGASPDNANLSFIIVATNISANTWFYDGQEAGGQGAFLKTDSSNNLTFGDGIKTQFSGVSIPAGTRIICISGGAYNGTPPKIWFDGVLGFTGTVDTSGHWVPTPAFRSLFGSGAFPSSNTFNGKGYMIAVLRGLLTDTDAAALSANPWQLFAGGDEEGDLIIAGGSNTTAGISWTEADDTVSILSVVSNTSSLAWIEADDSHTSTVTLTDRASLAYTESDDIFSVSGIVTDRTTITWTESDDTFNTQVVEFDAATLGWTETNDSYGMTGSVYDNAQLGWLEDNDAMSSSGVATNRATFAWIESDDGALFLGGLSQSGQGKRRKSRHA